MFIRDADSAARDANALVLDLRGNHGGFDGEAWLLADALGTKPSLAALDLFAGTRAGAVQLAKEHTDRAAATSPPMRHWSY
ncbi:MAG TPA: hypothetical protein VNZ27_08470 [Rhodanobacter sp.]|nr:hypothetical protein [Rhodanobacter sp.]